MAENQSERMAVAAHLHVLLRRHLGRVTDVEWMASHRDYAQAMAELALRSSHEDLRVQGQRMKALMTPTPAPAPTRDLAVEAEAVAAQRYVGGVRW